MDGIIENSGNQLKAQYLKRILHFRENCKNLNDNQEIYKKLRNEMLAIANNI